MTRRPAPADSVQAAQSEAAAAERRRAIRALLVRPLLGQREAPEVYAAVVRHRRELTEWFAEHTGWQLVVDVSGGLARLHKTDDRADATRPATAGRQARAFDRRRYTLLCVALAALDERGGQTTLHRIADDVAAHSREHDGVAAFDAARMTDRRALVDALKLLTELGILAVRDGDSDRYAASGSGDALYDIDDRRIAQLIAAPSSPSLVDAPEQLPVEAYPDSDEGQRLAARHRVMRRLLDEPVVYYADLGERERDWLAHSLAHVHGVLDGDVGFAVERRAEGLLTVDPDREVTDETFPDGGSTVKHAALLLAEQLAETARAARRETSADEADAAAPVVADADVEATTRRLIDAYGQRCGWSNAYRESDDGAAQLAAEALALLARFGLVARADGGWRPRPAIARYAPAEPTRAPSAKTARAAGAGQPGAAPSLFDSGEATAADSDHDTAAHNAPGQADTPDHGDAP